MSVKYLGECRVFYDTPLGSKSQVFPASEAWTIESNAGYFGAILLDKKGDIIKEFTLSGDYRFMAIAPETEEAPESLNLRPAGCKEAGPIRVDKAKAAEHA